MSCPICYDKDVEVVICWNAHSLCQECYGTMMNSARSSNRNCAECREPMFNWGEDSSRDPTTAPTTNPTTTTTTTTTDGNTTTTTTTTITTTTFTTIYRGSQDDPFYDSPTRAGDEDVLTRLPTIFGEIPEGTEDAVALGHIFNRIIQNYASRGWTGVDRYDPRVVRDLAREFAVSIEYDFESFSLENLNWMIVGSRLELNRSDRTKMVKFLKQFVLAGYPIHVVAAWIGSNLSTIHEGTNPLRYTDARPVISDRTININHIRDNTRYTFQTIRQIR